MKRKCMAALAAIVLLVLVACGRQGQPDVKDPVGQTDADTYAYWTDDRWVYNGGMGKIPRYTLYLSEEIKGPDMDPDGVYDSHSSDYRTLGNVIYGLERFERQTQGVWELKCYISRYDGTGGEIGYQPLELPLPEEYGADKLFVAAFDVQSDQELVLFLQGQKDGEFSCYLAMHVTPEGETLSVTDLYPAMQELGVKTTYFYAAYVDGEGYYYLIPGWAEGAKGDDVNVLDPAGKLVGSMTPPAEGYERASWAMKLPDGSPVFSWRKLGKGSVLMAVYDRGNNVSRTLFEQNSLLDCRLWTPARDGYLYYVDFYQGDTLCRCNIRTGSVEECMYFPQLNLDGVPLAQLIIGESGEPEILGRRGKETVICRLGTEKPETEALRLLSANGFGEYIESCAASFSRKHRDFPVQLEYPEWNEDAYWDRAMAELVSGKGADMYYVSSLSEMSMLQEKGVLMDLSELISEETLEALWPYVLESGTLDGQLVGITPEPLVETMIVLDEIWPEDHWTLQEALDVIEKHPQIRYPLINNFDFDRDDILQWLVLYNLADSPFLDLEKGSCDFDNPLFIRALEVAGACEKPVDYDVAHELYQEKDWVASLVWGVSIGSLLIDKNYLGEGYHVVGFPTEGKSGTYGFGGFLVVNRKTEHAEQAAEFLEELLSYKSQYSSKYPARRDMMQKDRLTKNYTGDIVVDYGNGNMHIIPPGPDGDYDYLLREYREIMESAVGITADTSAIDRIIREEAGNYFSGIRDAAATAGIIQNRVQMYLKEQQ